MTILYLCSLIQFYKFYYSKKANLNFFVKLKKFNSIETIYQIVSSFIDCMLLKKNTYPTEGLRL